MELKEGIVPDKKTIEMQFKGQASLTTQKCQISKLKPLLRNLGIEIKDEDVPKMGVEMDVQDGWFTLEQFQNLEILKPPVEQHSLHEVIQALSVFDKDDDGVISLEDLREAMKTYGVSNEDGTNSKMQNDEFDIMKKALQEAHT